MCAGQADSGAVAVAVVVAVVDVVGVVELQLPRVVDLNGNVVLGLAHHEHDSSRHPVFQARRVPPNPWQHHLAACLMLLVAKVWPFLRRVHLEPVHQLAIHCTFGKDVDAATG